MSLRLGDIAPDFKAKTSIGDISFHEYLGDSWGILFSHPADFTPVCTTELGRTAALQEEFAKRNVKVLALSVDGVESHHKWIKDINDEKINGEKYFNPINHHIFITPFISTNNIDNQNTKQTVESLNIDNLWLDKSIDIFQHNMVNIKDFLVEWENVSK